MPGIVGLITKMPRTWAEPQLLDMVRAVQYGSLYDTGTWMNEPEGVYVGWSAHKKSIAGVMPLCNERGDVSLVFSGEDFSEPHTINRLRARGHAAQQSGASYLVHVYEEEPSFPASLNGRFHGLVADRTKRTVTLFNDRYGMHRLYYFISKEAFYFSAEAKAILAVHPELRRPSHRSLGELLTCGCFLDDRTLFEHIHSLPPAASWVFRNGSLEQTKTYFEPREWEEQAPLEGESYYQHLRTVLTRNLDRYFAGEQRIGLSLTGGLDTRVIMACHRPPSGSLSCYTFGGMYRDCQDVQLASRVASACSQQHQVITVGNDFLSNFATYAERTVEINEGWADVSRSPDLYVSERARDIAPVKLVGTYGSEILRQAVMFKPVPPTSGVFCHELLPYFNQAAATYASLRTEHPVTFAAFRQSPSYHYGILALEQSQLTVRSPYLDNEFVQTVYRAPREIPVQYDVRLRLIEDEDPALSKIRTDLGRAGNGGRFTRAICRKLLEFTHKAEYAYDYGMPQWVARMDSFFSPFHLERLFLGRHKFYHFRIWYRDVLSKYLRELLLDRLTISRPYLNRRGLEAVVTSHLRGDRNYTTTIHKLITLELLHRRFLD